MGLPCTVPSFFINCGTFPLGGDQKRSQASACGPVNLKNPRTRLCNLQTRTFWVLTALGGFAAGYGPMMMEPYLSLLRQHGCFLTLGAVASEGVSSKGRGLLPPIQASMVSRALSKKQSSFKLELESPRLLAALNMSVSVHHNRHRSVPECGLLRKSRAGFVSCKRRTGIRLDFEYCEV